MEQGRGGTGIGAGLTVALALVTWTIPLAATPAQACSQTPSAGDAVSAGEGSRIDDTQRDAATTQPATNTHAGAATGLASAKEPVGCSLVQPSRSRAAIWLLALSVLGYGLARRGSRS
jgi:hypothetical protein